VTIWRWMQDKSVRDRLHEACQNTMRHVLGRLQQAATQAIDTLSEVQSKGESESARVAAARCVLEQALHAAELTDIEERLDRLEAVAKSRDWKGSNDDQPNLTPSSKNRGVNGA
jgi:hypothetical protein